MRTNGTRTGKGGGGGLKAGRAAQAKPKPKAKGSAKPVSDKREAASRVDRGEKKLEKKIVAAKVPLILIVEDFTDAREMYAEYFTFLGYRVTTAENGLEAVDKAGSQHPDVILMDLSLPILDGWEATRRLKASDKTKHIPVIALTGNALAGHDERARKAGCDSYLTKPCLPESVEKEIRRVLGTPATDPVR
jgi:CheY-like chemotaxis protein